MLRQTDLQSLVDRFREGSLTKPEWNHAAHLRVGLWYVFHHGDGALDALRTAIRQLNARHGTPNTDDRGYHETVTAAYVRILAMYLARCPEVDFPAGAHAIVQSPIGQRGFLERFWSHSRLWSVQARREWVDPDLAPLELPTELLEQPSAASR